MSDFEELMSIGLEAIGDEIARRRAENEELKSKLEAMTRGFLVEAGAASERYDEIEELRQRIEKAKAWNRMCGSVHYLSLESILSGEDQ